MGKPDQIIVPARPRCKICRHEKKVEIEELILTGVPIRQIAKRYGMAASSVIRHKQDHMLDAGAKAFTRPMGSLGVKNDNIKQPPDATTVQVVPFQVKSGEEVLNTLEKLVSRAEGIYKAVWEDAPKKDKNAQSALRALEGINRFMQTYVSFMDMAQKNQGEKELEEWRELGQLVWEFIDSRGLRDDFENELRTRGIYFDR